MYKVEFTHNAAKELSRLSRQNNKLYQRLINVFDDLAHQPFMGKPLKGQLQGDYSIRVWDYRIVYTVHKTKLVIYIIDVGHRREIYRRN